jgi:hypothetical protein
MISPYTLLLAHFAGLRDWPQNKNTSLGLEHKYFSIIQTGFRSTPHDFKDIKGEKIRSHHNVFAKKKNKNTKDTKTFFFKLKHCLGGGQLFAEFRFSRRSLNLTAENKEC